ncbi:MAG: asparagine synthase (glutamine-hydrolyzing) [Thermoanaerobaculia bacterium]
MCGINGIYRRRSAPPIDRRELLRTRDAMARRGPDGAGDWVSADGQVALGHRRLAIIDLSPGGAQPMSTPDGRLTIVFNGELYNYRALRADLEDEGAHFRTASDTEVLLELYRRLGERMLPLLRGMFALAIWDAAGGELFLARDPYGIKPLYYCDDGATLRFASQVKALEAGGAVSRRLDPAGLAGFLAWGCVPEPYTLRREVRALPAGHFARLAGDGWLEISPPAPEVEPAAATLGEALGESVRSHLVSDVPVAIFLSAGLDSSLVATLARRELPESPSFLTLNFEEVVGTALDEAPMAARIAAALGGRHVVRTIGRRDVEALWPEMLAAMDQPSIDGFNTFLISRLAAEAGFKVVLSGLGGDEIFGSYPSFRDVPRWARWATWLERVPGLARRWPAVARRLAPTRPKLEGLMRCGSGLAGAYYLRRALFLREDLGAALGVDAATASAVAAAYSPWLDARCRLAEGLLGDPARVLADPWLAVHRLESTMYLRNQLLRDADWASMAHSVELRVPLVDPRLTRALAAQRFEPARSFGKTALVRRLAPELPRELHERPKTGFHLPIAEWIAPLAGGGGRSIGGQSRSLVRRVLAEFGVDAAAVRDAVAELAERAAA